MPLEGINPMNINLYNYKIYSNTDDCNLIQELFLASIQTSFNTHTINPNNLHKQCL